MEIEAAELRAGADALKAAKDAVFAAKDAVFAARAAVEAEEVAQAAKAAAEGENAAAGGHSQLTAAMKEILKVHHISVQRYWNATLVGPLTSGGVLRLTWRPLRCSLQKFRHRKEQRRR